MTSLITPGRAMTPVLSLRNVSKRFKQTVALSNVSLDVPRGVVFALLGENGMTAARTRLKFGARLDMCPTRLPCTTG